jgi:hypothetical protein
VKRTKNKFSLFSQAKEAVCFFYCIAKKKQDRIETSFAELFLQNELRRPLPPEGFVPIPSRMFCNSAYTEFNMFLFYFCRFRIVYEISRNPATFVVTKFRIILLQMVNSFKMLLFLNYSAQTTLEGIQNSVYINHYGIPRNSAAYTIPFVHFFRFFLYLNFHLKV